MCQNYIISQVVGEQTSFDIKSRYSTKSTMQFISIHYL